MFHVLIQAASGERVSSFGAATKEQMQGIALSEVLDVMRVWEPFAKSVKAGSFRHEGRGKCSVLVTAELPEGKRAERFYLDYQK